MKTGIGIWGWAWGSVSLAVVYLMAVYVIPGFVDRSSGDAHPGTGSSARQTGQCTKHLRAPFKIPIEHGVHKGQSWSVIASIESGHACGAWWSLGMEFLPQGDTPGSWKGFWEIPAGGHLPASATISARDETTGEDRVVSGIVGWRVRTVVFRTRSGHRFVAHPKAPEERLLKQFVWLRNLRYFLRFYPVGDPVMVAKLLDFKGGTIKTVDFRLGEVMAIP